MNLNDYQNSAMRTLAQKNEPPAIVQLMHGPMGICGEAGELIDAVKKHVIYGKPLDLENIHEELGDILWYVARTAKNFNFTLEGIAAANLAKLQKRYPQGFTQEAAVARADKAPAGA